VDSRHPALIYKGGMLWEKISAYAIAIEHRMREFALLTFFVYIGLKMFDI
jgi:hypothetical protein